MKDLSVLKERIPSRLRDFPEYRLFLVYAGEADSETPEELKAELDADISQGQDWLRENQKSSMLGLKNTVFRAQSKYLDFLKTIEKKFAKYL